MPVSVAHGLQSKEDSVRSEAADVWEHSSLLFWKGVFGVGIDEEFMFSWCICDGLIVVCFVAVLLFVCMECEKRSSLELFWSNILLFATPFLLSYNSTYPNPVEKMLKTCCDVMKKTTDLNRFSTGFPGDHVENMLFSCGFERWE